MDLEYSIKRSSKRKRLSITVERDRQVVVHAPERISDERIEDLVESKRQWIYEKVSHPQKYRGPTHPPGKELVSGESALYLGQEYKIELVDKDQNEIRFDHGFLVPECFKENAMEVLRDWYITKAKEKILPRIETFAKVLGVDCRIARITDNQYRWGSCTPKNNVHINWRLIKAPMFVIDYVIVHELAHLLEGNHTARFWNIVETQCPKMKKAKSWLKEHGNILEEEI